MKRLIAIVLLFAMILVCSSCGTSHKNNIGNTYFLNFDWDMSVDEAKKCETDNLTLIEETNTDIDKKQSTTLSFNITNNNNTFFSTADVTDYDTVKAYLMFYDDKLTDIYISYEPEVITQTAVNKLNDCFSENFATPCYKDVDNSYYRYKYYKENSLLELSANQESSYLLVSLSPNEKGKPAGMSDRTYDFGITALQTVDDYLNGLKSYDEAYTKLQNIHSSVETTQLDTYMSLLC